MHGGSKGTGFRKSAGSTGIGISWPMEAGNRRDYGVTPVGRKWGRREDSGADWEQHLAIRTRFHGSVWEVRDEWNPRRVSGFIVERDFNPSDTPAVPTPGAAWLFDSGVAVLGGLRLARRKQ
jgi:hypothetical protein